MPASQILSEVYVTFKGLFRYRDALFWIIVFPILVTTVMIGIFARGDEGVSFELGIQSSDPGWLNETIYTVLNATGMFKIVAISGGLEEAVANGTVDIGLYIPEGASDNISNGVQAYLEIYYVKGDSGSETGARTLASVLSSISKNISMIGFNIASSVVPWIKDRLLFILEPIKFEMKELQPETLATVGGLRAYYAFSIIGIQSLYAGIFASISLIVDRRREGVFPVILSSPIRSSILFASDTLAIIFMILLSAGVILATALAMGADYSAFTLEEALLGVVLIIVGAMSMIGLGLLIAGFTRSQEGAMALANIIAFPMMFIGGFTVPKFLLPQSLQTVAEVFPLSRVIEAVRKIAVYGYTPQEALGYALPGIVAGMTLFIMGALVYRRVVERIAEAP